jgi:hypothetical protein
LIRWPPSLVDILQVFQRTPRLITFGIDLRNPLLMREDHFIRVLVAHSLTFFTSFFFFLKRKKKKSGTGGTGGTDGIQKTFEKEKSPKAK